MYLYICKYIIYMYIIHIYVYIYIYIYREREREREKVTWRSDTAPLTRYVT
jgi:hypothetical protein